MISGNQKLRTRIPENNVPFECFGVNPICSINLILHLFYTIEQFENHEQKWKNDQPRRTSKINSSNERH